jgi:NO-binding membrane sensor protein with MHYT domain
MTLSWHHDFRLVTLSILIAIVASYAALAFAARVQRDATAPLRKKPHKVR